MRSIRFRYWGLSLFALLAGTSGTSVAEGQTDYYNLDRGRPSRIEDAIATELYALGVKLAPVRVEQEGDGSLSRWLLLPEIAYGLAPGTSLEVGFPVVALADGPTGLKGIELSLFHSLNVETTALPAFAIRGDLELPVGALGPDRVFRSLTAMATRTHSIARFHVNGRYTFQSGDGVTSSGHEEGQWLAGIAADRAFPLRALLLIGELFATAPAVKGDDVRWTASGGARYQLNPYLTLDGGVGRTLSGDPGWHLTFGGSIHLGLRPLVRGGR